jgi:hypothetical protein
MPGSEESIMETAQDWLNESAQAQEDLKKLLFEAHKISSEEFKTRWERVTGIMARLMWMNGFTRDGLGRLKKVDDEIEC